METLTPNLDIIERNERKEQVKQFGTWFKKDSSLEELTNSVQKKLEVAEQNVMNLKQLQEELRIKLGEQNLNLSIEYLKSLPLSDRKQILKSLL